VCGIVHVELSIWNYAQVRGIVYGSRNISSCINKYNVNHGDDGFPDKMVFLFSY
jgi:hypothetical protein